MTKEEGKTRELNIHLLINSITCNELTLGKLGKNVWQNVAMQGLDPNRISTYVLGVLVLKKKGSVLLRRINRYKSSFHVSINAYLFLQSPKS